MELTPSIQAFWAAAKSHLNLDQDTPAHFAFGDSPAMADELLDLVLSGTKTATAGLLADYEADGDPLPAPGQLFIVLDGQGHPRALIKTTQVRVGPLNSCDQQFAYDEGEGDRTLAWWMAAHTRFFARRCADLKIQMHPEIDVVFEQFACLYPLPPSRRV